MKMIIRFILILAVLFPSNTLAKQYDFATHKDFKRWFASLNHNERGEAELRLLNKFKKDDYYYLQPKTIAVQSKKDYYRCKKMIEKRDGIISLDWARVAKCNINRTYKFGVIVAIKEFANADLKVFYGFSGWNYLVDNNALASVSRAPDATYKRDLKEAIKSANYDLNIDLASN
tara:strand:- start:126 stop:647 length:522 start_codon:yes stop_codon:yes gene_type:complete